MGVVCMSLVNVKNGFSRKYLIFANEDAGYEAGKKPSGHIKLEVRDGKGVLRSVIHNIRPGNGAFDYALYLLCADGRFTGQVKAGTFRMERGKAELEWFFDPLDVGKSGFGIDKFNVFAVVVEHVDERYPDNQRVYMHKGGVICPLVAYVNKRADWRSMFESLLFKKETSDVKHYPEEAALKHIPPEQPGTQPEQPDAQPEQPDAQPEQHDAHPGEDAKAEHQVARPEQPDTQPERQDAWQEQDEGAVWYEKHPEQQDAHPGERSPCQTQTKPPADVQPGDMPPCGPNISNQGCAYLDGSPCSALANGTAGDSCGSCIFRSGEDPAETKPHGDIARLIDDLERSFKTSDPFHSKRSDYMWWKVTDPVNLNNILYQNGVRTPLMFSPAVMMSYYRYKHLIIGIFTHRTGQNFIVCGVPGMHMVDGKPFGEMSKWVQAEGNRSRYGAFGYWLIYINPDDGKILEL
jgi:hypothetical protein